MVQENLSPPATHTDVVPKWSEELKPKLLID
jgi:hypothetical protein